MTLSKADLFNLIVSRTLRVPLPKLGDTSSTEVDGYARQLDVVLMDAGFKADRSILLSLRRLSSSEAHSLGSALTKAALQTVGGMVRHNVYFRSFPKNVPDTLEFWGDLMGRSGVNLPFNKVNLLTLKGYGKYQHTYEEMVEAHGEKLQVSGNSLRVLTAGGTLDEEGLRLYRMLAGSTVPLSEGDMAYLKDLAEIYVGSPGSDVEMPIREVKATVNAIRANKGMKVDVGSPTDVLRLAISLSGGDVSMVEKTKFKSFPKRVRRVLMSGLEEVSGSNDSLAMVLQYSEQWKRLGEKIHPHEFRGHDNAKAVFSTARGEGNVVSYASRLESAFVGFKGVKAKWRGEAKWKGEKDLILVLSQNPGSMFRNLDRALTAGVRVESLIPVLQASVGKVSGRVLISLHEHLTNRLMETPARMFRNRAGKAWVCDENRSVLLAKDVAPILTLLETEIARRLPSIPNLVVETEARGIALPLSEKNKGTGFGVLPRGSRIPVTNEILRFFCYWKEKGTRTDYDLSVLLLDCNFNVVSHCSWTSLRDNAMVQMVHSGDITSAPQGASEFVDVDLRRLGSNVAYIVPQVNVFAGESFEEAAESFFGFMERVGGKTIEKTRGLPFEPATVRAKSEMRGKGKVALPVMFARDSDAPSGWSGVWSHVYLNGSVNCNMAERNGRQTGMMLRGSVLRNYFTVGRLADMLMAKSRKDETVGVTYIGLQAPPDLKVEKTYTQVNFIELIPE